MDAWLVDLLFGWAGGWMDGWLIGWLAGWLEGRLAGARTPALGVKLGAAPPVLQPHHWPPYRLISHVQPQHLATPQN